MADNFLEFSEVLPHLTADEEAWLRRQLEIVCVFGDREYPEDQLPDDLDTPDAEFYGCRAWRDLPGEYPYDGVPVGFEFEFHDDHAADRWGHHLWFYAEEIAVPERIAHLVQKFLERLRPQECWSLTYATTCSKPRAGSSVVVPSLLPPARSSGRTLSISRSRPSMRHSLRSIAAGMPGTRSGGRPMLTYELHIDGPLLRRQRQFLLCLQAGRGEDRELLEGLLALTVWARLSWGPVSR